TARFDGENTVGVDGSGQEVPAVHGPTKLGIDCESGAITGCGGGWNNALRAGIAFDTRDFEPDPNSGVFAEATGVWSAKAFGSNFNYLRLTIISRYYQNLLPAPARLVLAARLLYSMQTSLTPFFAMDRLSMSDGDQRGLGGETTLRGY